MRQLGDQQQQEAATTHRVGKPRGNKMVSEPRSHGHWAKREPQGPRGGCSHRGETLTARDCLKERVGKKPLGTDFHCLSKLSFSLTKHGQNPASLGKTAVSLWFDEWESLYTGFCIFLTCSQYSLSTALIYDTKDVPDSSHSLLLPSKEIFLSLLWLCCLMQGPYPEKSSPYLPGPDTSCFPTAGEWGQDSEGNSLGHFQTLSQRSRCGSCELHRWSLFLSPIWSFIFFKL